MAAIQYPYAVDGYGSHCHIDDAVRGREYRCGDCSMLMILKKGKVRVHHFAHKGTTCQPRPDPENYLHQVAQDKIISGFRNAQNNSAKYYLGVRCMKCYKFAASNIATEGTRVDKERVVVEGTRSDIVVEGTFGKQLIIEIINTHDLEDETRSRYIASGIPVFKREVHWKMIQELDKRVIADDVLNGKGMEICAECRRRQSKAVEKRRQEQEELKRRKKVVDAALRKMVRSRSSNPSFRTWFEVSKPGWSPSMRPVRMYPKTQRLVFANAIILTELGFEQHNPQKLWLFRYVIRRKPFIVLYADLAGSDVVPIYEDTAAMLYVPALDEQRSLEQYVIASFGEALQEAGVDVRTGFESAVSIERKGVNPTRHVSKAMLDSLIRWGNTCQRCHSMSVSQGVCWQCGYDAVNSLGVDSDTVDLMENFQGKLIRSPRASLYSDVNDV